MATSESPAVFVQANEMAVASSPLRVSMMNASDHERWDDFVFAHPQGTFFHQSSWMRVMESTYGYRPYYVYAERDGQITGIAPTFLVSNWLSGRSLISLPFAVYGGVCAADSESENALIARLEELAIELDVEYLELRNRTGDIRPGYHAVARYATFTKPLITDLDKLYAGLPKDIRYMVRKAEKAGLQVRRGLDQLNNFYRLMTINLRRLGTPAFPHILFQNLIHEFPNQVDLALVYCEDKPVAGGMSFKFREWMQPYYIGSLEEAKTLAANDYLWWSLIRYAAETGHRTFDFGRSKKVSGNFDFKKKWNPAIESLSYQVRLVRRTTVPNFSPANPKFDLATNLWKKLPLGLTRVIGPRVVRWFP